VYCHSFFWTVMSLFQAFQQARLVGGAFQHCFGHSHKKGIMQRKVFRPPVGVERLELDSSNTATLYFHCIRHRRDTSSSAATRTERTPPQTMPCIFHVTPQSGRRLLLMLMMSPLSIIVPHLLVWELFGIRLL
jgi:hypothetical protein